MTLRRMAGAISAFLVVLLCAAQEPAKETTAIVHARIITMTGSTIDNGTILIQDGKITAIGKDVKAPDGAEIIDAEGLTAMPGLVNPYSRIGGTVRGGGTKSLPHYLAYDEVNPAIDMLATLPRTGYTSICLYPSNGTISGRAVLLKPVGLTRHAIVAEKAAYLRVDMAMGTPVKQFLTREFQGAKKAFDAEKARLAAEAAKKKAAADAKKKGAKPAPKKGPAPPPATKPAPPPRKPDEKSKAWIEYFQGKYPAIIEISSPAELLHFWQVFKEIESLKPNYAIRGGSNLWLAAEQIGSKKLTVILTPFTTYEPYTRDPVNPASELSAAGATIVFQPSSDSVFSHEKMFFRVGEMVKFGLDRDHALRALTINAATAAGIADRVGSLEKGKDADILLLSGDPLDVLTHVEKTLINGRVVFERKETK